MKKTLHLFIGFLIGLAHAVRSAPQEDGLYEFSAGDPRMKEILNPDHG